MNLLAIDTSTDQPALALSTADGRQQEASAPGWRRHGRDLVPAIGALLAEAGIRVADLQAVAVGLGPGSYTGLRIGLIAARTLAYVAGADLIGLNSLEGWARTASSEALRVHVVGDAQRGDVYSADFLRAAPHSPLTRASASRIESREAWSARLDNSAEVVGPGLVSSAILAAVPAGLISGPVLHSPAPSRALGLLDLAVTLWNGGHRDDLWTLEPNYLRRSAAEDQWAARGGGELIPKTSGHP